MAWDFCNDPAFEPELEWTRQFVHQEIEPLDLVKPQMSRESFKLASAPLKEAVKKRGLWAGHLDPELGGQGLGQVKLALLHEILGRTQSAPEIFGNQAPDSGNGELLAIGANDEQKDRWLWPLLAGELTSAFSLTEPHSAGSDPTQITTSARLDGDEYVIDGHKWFASGARDADFVLAMVVTEPDGSPYERASMFVIERGTPGMEVVRNVHTMDHPYAGTGDQHVRGHAEIRFTERAVSRTLHGKVLADKQFVQDFIAESATEIQAARLLTLQAAWHWDTFGSSASRVEIAQVKYWCAGVLYRVIDRAIQVHGALGYSSDLPLEYMYRIARNFRISDGADEVHKSFIARRLVKNYEPVAGWPSEHIPTRRSAAEARFSEYLDLASENL